MKKSTEILSFFAEDAITLSQSHVNLVVEKAYRIAVKYLELHRIKISKLINREELTLQELAIDCIAGLFIKEHHCEIISIQQSFNNWEPPITSEDECIFFLNKVVGNRVEQHIFKLLKEEDPFFSKFLDSVNYLIRTSGYYKFYFLGKTFIAETDLENFEKCFISTDEFEKLPTILFQNKKTLLGNLFSHLKNETDFNPAIPLNDLINRLKHINFSEYFVNEFVSNEYKKIEINEIVDGGLNTAMEKLLKSYVQKGKLNADERKAFESALKEMADDLCDGGINPGLYHYLVPHLNGLSEIEYKTKYHNILEYLLKVMKSNISEKLSEKD